MSRQGQQASASGQSSNGPAAPSTWTARYGEKHRLCRLTVLPVGILAPTKVRIYSRAGHYVLQWWDSAAKRTLSDRVDGDLVAAIAQARQIEERLLHFQGSGQGQRRLGHRELVTRFLDDQAQRANGGQIEPATVRRYASALTYYQDFTERSAILKTFPHVSRVDRAFQLAFAAFLANRQISSNGHPHSKRRPMRSQSFVEDAVRAMFQWAADPERGNLIPAGFRNPFLERARQRRTPVRDQTGEPDITVAMAQDFLLNCDAFQLVLFAPLIFCGLRASEPCFLFREYLEAGWLKVPCNPELAYVTKGRRDKRFPLSGPLQALWRAPMEECQQGLLYLRRAVTEGRESPALLGIPLAGLVEEFRCRCGERGDLSAGQRLRLRDELLKQAGGLSYDQIEAEFRSLARRLGWPAAATIKDFRHLFSTTMANAGMPEPYRRYLMGHSPGKAALVTYTHLNQIQTRYQAALEQGWGPLLDAFECRSRELRLLGK